MARTARSACSFSEAGSRFDRGGNCRAGRIHFSIVSPSATWVCRNLQVLASSRNTRFPRFRHEEGTRRFIRINDCANLHDLNVDDLQVREKFRSKELPPESRR